QGEVEAELQLRAGLRPDLRVARVARVERGRAVRTGEHGVLVAACEGARLPAGFPPGTAQPEGVDQVEVPERLLGNDPRGRELRVLLELELGAEGRVVVEAHRGREEDPVLPAQLLLDVEADRLVLDEV